MDAKELERIFNQIIGLEERKADISEDIKELVSAYCLKYDVKPAHIKAALKKYKQHQKDEGQFQEDEFAIDSICSKIIPEYGE